MPSATPSFGITETASTFGVLQSVDISEKVSTEKIPGPDGKIVETAAVSKTKTVKVEGVFKTTEATVALPGAGTSIAVGSDTLLIIDQSLKKAAGKNVKASFTAELDDASTLVPYAAAPAGG